jgi:pyruvate dehydrogenase E2 component (dihydrolipoamide acetyltransferase)
MTVMIVNIESSKTIIFYNTMAEIVRMPALSDTMTEGTLIAWHKNVGDKIKNGDLLAEIETDKAVMEFQSPFDGVLLHIGIEAGNAVPVNDVIAVIGKAGEDVKAILASAGQAAAPKTEEAPAKEVIETLSAALTATSQAVTTDEEGRFKASPLAKAMAKEEGIDLSKVAGSGDEGRIVKKDVEAFLENKKGSVETVAAPTSTVSPEGAYEDVQLSQMRKTIARRLGESKFTAPHFYLTMEICMDKLIETRKQLKKLSDDPISFNDFIVKACAKSLQKNPVINASWLGDRIRYYKYVNIGVAVAMEEGLVVPVIKNADMKSLSQISSEVRNLAEMARDRKLQPQDMTGNTFTISNLGMFGIEEFTAIINPPDACILAVGRISQRLIMENGEVKESNFMKVTLSCDHRVVDGANGARFLQTLKDILEEPMRLMI